MVFSHRRIRSSLAGITMFSLQLGLQSSSRQHPPHCLRATRKTNLLHDVHMHLAIAVNSPTGVIRLLCCGKDQLPLQRQSAGLSSCPRIIAASADGQNFAKNLRRVMSPLLCDPRVLYRDSFAKYAAAFFRISFSMRRRAFSSLSLA